MAKITMSELLTPLSEEELMQLEEAAKAPPSFDEDCPEMTSEQLQQFRPRYIHRLRIPVLPNRILHPSIMNHCAEM